MAHDLKWLLLRASSKWGKPLGCALKVLNSPKMGGSRSTQQPISIFYRVLSCWSFDLRLATQSGILLFYRWIEKKRLNQLLKGINPVNGEDWKSLILLKPITLHCSLHLLQKLHFVHHMVSKFVFFLYNFLSLLKEVFCLFVCFLALMHICFGRKQKERSRKNYVKAWTSTAKEINFPEVTNSPRYRLE